MIGIGERIHVPKESIRLAPREFYWRGNRHVIRTWEAQPQTASLAQGRRLYRVRTVSGLRCMLSEDPGRGQWRLEKLLPPAGQTA